MNKYIYEGPVTEFDRVVAKKWKGETMAVSERKARNNLIFRYKKQYGRVPGTKIGLPGEITKIETEGWENDE